MLLIKKGFLLYLKYNKTAMSLINSVRYKKERQSHAITHGELKTMINAFEEIHTRDDVIFLKWEFNTLRSE